MNRFLNSIYFLAIAVSLCFGYTINDVPEGWATQGSGTTGGIGGEQVTVSNMSELKKHVGSSGKKIILVEPGTYSGSISIKSSDKSILGTAPGVKIKGTMNIGGKNLIIRNIAIQDRGCNNYEKCRSGSDCVYIGGKGAENIWLDHLDISDGMDGNLDITRGPDNLTITWTKFSYSSRSKPHAFSNLIAGSDGESVSKGRLNMTYAYCWWADNVVERMPRGRFGKIHVLNNLYTSKRTKYCCGSGHQMKMLIEKNAFLCGGVAVRSIGKPPFNWKCIDNIGKAKGINKSNGDGFVPPYTIKKFEVSEVEAKVRAGAGNTMTLGKTDIQNSNISKVSNTLTPFLHISNRGWVLNNPSDQKYSIQILTLNGKVLHSSIDVDVKGIIEIPRYPSALVIRFNNKSISNMYVPSGF